MPDPLPLKLEAHALDRVFDLTPYTKQCSWSEGTTAPWDWIQAELALPLGEVLTREHRVSNEPSTPPEALGDTPAGNVTRIKAPSTRVSIDTGLWLKLTELPTGRVLAFGRIDDGGMNHGARGPGMVGSSCSVRSVGAWQHLRTLASEMIPQLRTSIGSLLSGTDWEDYAKLVGKLIQKADFRLVTSTDGLLARLAYIRIPSTLFPGVSWLSDLFLPAYDADSGARNAPLRVMDEVPVAGATAIASLVPSGTVLDTILGVFQREPRLIELFPSIEGPTNDWTKPGYQDARPVLIHRIAPWRTGPLSKMVLDESGNPQASLPISPRYDRKTWSLDKALHLTQNEVTAIAPRRSEQARINAVTVNWTVAGGASNRLLPMAGLPLVDKEDVRNHGVRLLELNWDMAPDQFGEGALVSRLRTVGLLGWQFYGLGHVFKTGSVSCPYLGLRARAGEPVSIEIGRPTPFTAYITRVTHTVEIRGGASVSAKTQLTLDRGLYDEKKRDAFFYQERAAVFEPAEKTQTPTAAPEPDGLELAGQAALAKALSLWGQRIVDPKKPLADQNATEIRNGALINDMINGTGGLDFSATTYERDGDFEWCGAFVGTCWADGNLDLGLRRLYFSSTLRLDYYARHVNYGTSAAGVETDATFAPDADQSRRRKFLLIDATTTVDQVLQFGPRAGDILIVGDRTVSIAADENHIALVDHFDPATELFWCVDGNANGLLPSGAKNHGVVKTTRPLQIPARKSPTTFVARMLFRPAYKDVGL